MLLGSGQTGDIVVILAHRDFSGLEGLFKLRFVAVPQPYIGLEFCEFLNALSNPSSVLNTLVPPKKVFAVTSSRNELDTRASNPSLSLLAGSHNAAHDVGAV